MAIIGEMSGYLENELLDHWLRGNAYSPPSDVYLAIGDTPAANGDQTSWFGECSGTGYQRQLMSFRPAKSQIDGDVMSSIDEPIEFTGDTDWPANVLYFTIWDAQTGGNILFRGQLEVTHDLSSPSATLSIAKDALAVSLIGENWSHYLRRKLLDLVLRGDSFASPTIHAAITFELPRPDQSGSELAEPQGAGYSRVGHANWNLSFNEATNDGAITFPQATADYADWIRAAVLTDASSGGNWLVASGGSLILDPIPGPGGIVEIKQNDTPEIADENYTVKLY